MAAEAINENTTDGSVQFLIIESPTISKDEADHLGAGVLDHVVPREPIVTYSPVVNGVRCPRRSREARWSGKTGLWGVSFGAGWRVGFFFVGPFATDESQV